jgi:hypothetical protein
MEALKHVVTVQYPCLRVRCPLPELQLHRNCSNANNQTPRIISGDGPIVVNKVEIVIRGSSLGEAPAESLITSANSHRRPK